MMRKIGVLLLIRKVNTDILLMRPDVEVNCLAMTRGEPYIPIATNIDIAIKESKRYAMKKNLGFVDNPEKAKNWAENYRNRNYVHLFTGIKYIYLLIMYLIHRSHSTWLAQHPDDLIPSSDRITDFMPDF